MSPSLTTGLAPSDEATLTRAFEQALRNYGAAKIGSGGGGGGGGTGGGGRNTPPQATTKTTSQGNFSNMLNKLPGLKQQAMALLGGTGALAKILTGKATQTIINIDEFMTWFGGKGRDYYDHIQKMYGGIADINNIANETSKAAVDAHDVITGVYYNNQLEFSDVIDALTVETADGTKTQVNAMLHYFDKSSDVANSRTQVIGSLAKRQSLMLNKMSKTEQARLGMYEKGLRLHSSKIAELMERQISLTGKAGTQILDKVSANAKAVSDATGISYTEMTEGIAEIITDVQRFGNVQVKEAARIAGALQQMGVSYQSFGQMVDKFMNFDSAAESLGNLTTVFGVHFDAMEMMMLANEDQEEFLHRMREAFLDSGVAVEDMTLAQKRLAAQQMGMGIQDFENFMQEGRVVAGQAKLTAATDAANAKKGFEDMTKTMVAVTKNKNTLDDFVEYMQKRVFQTLRKEAFMTGQHMTLLNTKLKMKPPDQLEKTQAAVTGFIKGATVGSEGPQQLFAEQLAIRTGADPKLSEAEKAIIRDFVKNKSANIYNLVNDLIMKMSKENQIHLATIVGSQLLLSGTDMAKITMKASDIAAKLRKENLSVPKNIVDKTLVKNLLEDPNSAFHAGASKEKPFIVDFSPGASATKDLLLLKQIRSKSESIDPTTKAALDKLIELAQLQVEAMNNAKNGEIKPIEVPLTIAGKELLTLLINNSLGATGVSISVKGGNP